MSIAGENGNVFARSRLAVVLEPLARHGVLYEAGIAQHIGNGAGAVEAKAAPSVAAAELIGQMVDTVGRFDGALHCRWGATRSISFAVYDDGARATINTFGVFGR